MVRQKKHSFLVIRYKEALIVHWFRMSMASFPTIRKKNKGTTRTKISRTSIQPPRLKFRKVRDLFSLYFTPLFFPDQIQPVPDGKDDILHPFVGQDMPVEFMDQPGGLIFRIGDHFPAP